MKNAKLFVTLSSPDPGVIFDNAIATNLYPGDAPNLVMVSGRERRTDVDLEALARSSEDVTISWGLSAGFEFSKKYDTLIVRRSNFDLTPESFLDLVAGWPFETCQTSPPRPGWWADRLPFQGWALVLKAGGRRAVSERLIQRGPWRVLRDEQHGTVMLQLCDLEVDETLAGEQAAPGQALLEPVWHGGHYASQKQAFRSSVGDYKPSFYEPSTKTSVILVQDREVSAAEMGIASATRVHQIFEQPVEHVRFVYLDEAMARKQLPELWLRGLEVYAMTSTGERRIDTEYEPPPVEKPEWVKRLDAR